VRTARKLGACAPLLAALLSLFLSQTAAAMPEQASLHASFSPNRLGTPTTIGFSFHLATAEGTAPPPLTSMDIRMPAGMNYTSTTLGLSLCKPAVLQARGLAGCPPNSRLGYGSALVEVPFGTGAGHEVPEVQAVAGPSPSGNLVVLFYANGLYPVVAQLTFAGEVLPDSGAYGSQLATTVPLVASVPGGPNVSNRRRHGRLVAFHPRGVSVPEHCHGAGFPFAADFGFQDGSRASARTTVPCPPPHR
jgi:hypothetical protein